MASILAWTATWIIIGIWLVAMFMDVMERKG